MSAFTQVEQEAFPSALPFPDYICVDHFLPLGYDYSWVLPYVSSLQWAGDHGFITIDVPGAGRWHGRPPLRLGTEEEKSRHDELIAHAQAFLSHMSTSLGVSVSLPMGPRLVVNPGGSSGGDFHRDGINSKSRAVTVLLTEGPPTHFKEVRRTSSCFPDTESGSATLFKNAVHRTPKPRSELGRVVLAFEYEYLPLNDHSRLPEDLLGYGFGEREIAVAEHWSSIQSGNLSTIVTRSKKTKRQYYNSDM